MKTNLLCELQVRYRRKKESGKHQITESAQAAAFFRQIMLDELMIREMFVALYLNRANYVIGYHICSIGGKSNTIVDNKIILSTGLLCGSSSLIVAHNHPSGQALPSQHDNVSTQSLVNGCNAVDMKLLDSLIIVEDGYYSFADEGVLPTSTLWFSRTAGNQWSFLIQNNFRYDRSLCIAFETLLNNVSNIQNLTITSWISSNQ